MHKKPAALADATAAHKARAGLHRLWYAGGHSMAGLRAAWDETAFRQEVWIAVVLLPASALVGKNWVEAVLLASTVVAVIVVELLNSAVEAAVDRVGVEWHVLAKRAKDIGSAAVLVSLLLCGTVWATALWSRWR
ncbi:MAG: diacylglycerol kinase [Curvibacter sp.]|jgi:diacylglycerol kinase (ATP)|uniref:diacylglycerol kinase n=1 Tax=Curvibacter lanceolatus TaxID=86182 RepID=UPI0009FF86A7|nr:diacylglycerol kinase [Curvibacter lanceolatus]RUP34939.1 MAG: diacylglycerol kinase [Curvibacter sp.]